MAKVPIIWRLMRFMNRRFAVRNSSKLKRGELVLVLYHTGRKSGLVHATPLQYEEDGGDYYVASARGKQADWYRNVLANPEVEVLIKGRRIQAKGEAVSSLEEIANFLEMRLNRHPCMIRAMLRLEGLHGDFRRADILRVAENKALVILHPIA